MIKKTPLTKKPKTPKGWIELTRVYGGKDSKPIKFQPVLVQVSSIEHIRPRNNIGTKETGNRCTLQSNSGVVLNVKEKFSEIISLLSS